MPVTAYSEQNKKTNSDRFYTLSYLCNGCLSLIGLLISIIVALSIKEFNIVWSFLIFLPFPILGVFLSKLFTNAIIRIGTASKSKFSTLVSSICLFTFKYIIVLLPLIMGLIIIGLHNNVFNIYALVVASLIYPSSTLIVQWCFVRDYKKSNITKINNE